MEIKSKYISSAFKDCIWPFFEEEFSGSRAHTLKNYKNTIVAFVEYIKKDFLKVNEQDVKAYYDYLSRRVMYDGLSKRTMLTYQKNLRAAGCAIEKYISENKLPIHYKNYFRNSIEGDVRSISEDIWLARDDEVNKIISMADTPKDMLIMLMIVSGGLTANQIRNLKWEGMSEDETRFTYDDEGHFFEVDEIFLIAFREYKQEIISFKGEAKGLLFINRNGNPINTKGISTLIKKCREKAKVESEITARQLRDYGLTSRLFKLMANEETADEKASAMDESQITRMRELFVHFNLD